MTFQPNPHCQTMVSEEAVEIRINGKGKLHENRQITREQIMEMHSGKRGSEIFVRFYIPGANRHAAVPD
jgi:hypothetical protein